MPPPRSKRPLVKQCCTFKGMANCCQNGRKQNVPEKLRFLVDAEWDNDGAMLESFKLCGTLTESQLEVVKRARPPHREAGRITNVMAAAAVGKTTTMVALDTVLRGLGHANVMYCLFNRTAVMDVKDKLGKIGIATTEDVHTMDGWVQKSLGGSGGIARSTQRDESRKFWIPQENGLLLSDSRVCDRILNHFRAEIDAFLDEAGCASERTCKLCAYWVYKTYMGWVQSDKGIGHLDDDNVDRGGTHEATYYPCKLDYLKSHHAEEWEHQKLPGAVPATFYAERAREWWAHCAGTGIFYSYACATKYLQFCRHIFRYPVIIVDEAQDLTPCQLDLFVRLQEHADVFVVGDSVQCLYAWRGAAPSKIALLARDAPPTRDVKDDVVLSDSYRFGSGIADIANHVLYIKRHSKQASEWYRPYWVTGRGPPTEFVDTRGALPFPYTVIGRTNAGLCIEAIDILTEDPSTKICLIGDGVKELKRRLKQTLELCPFHRKEEPFEYRGNRYTGWRDFLSYIDAFEIDCSCELELLSTYGVSGGDELHRVVDLVKVHVLDAPVNENACHVLLTTVCKAKGLAWPHVKVLDDLKGLVQFEAVPSEPDETIDAVPMRFRATLKGDDLNSWYVAITRAEKRLLLPSKFEHLLSTLGSMDVPTTGFSEQEVAGIKDLLTDMKATLQTVSAERVAV